MNVATKNYEVYCRDEPSEYSGSYGVYIFENGKVIQHQIWKDKPTYKELSRICELYQTYYDKDQMLSKHKKIG